MKTIKNLWLKSGREEAIRRGHPWVFSGAVLKKDNDLNDGDAVVVKSHQDRQLGWGHYHDGSIMVKLIYMGQEAPSFDHIGNLLDEAWVLRKSLHLGPAESTTGFRLVHGEGDFLPGLIIDIYGEVAVFQAHSIGMHKVRNGIAEKLMQLEGLRINMVYDKSNRTLPKEYAQTVRDGYLMGEGKHAFPFLENGLHFLCDLEKGQKTGFFLDQRDNRNLLRQYVQEKSLLNTFSYSGGFSIYALASGALVVDSVDVSARAIDLIEDHLNQNGIGSDRHIAHTEDVLPFLAGQSKTWDIVILDPPAFAKSISKRHQAVQGYKRLNIAGMKRVSDGGLLWTFSCSQVVDATLFRDTIMAAALEANCRVRILHTLQQGPDHPVNLTLPESGYLKGLVLQIYKN